jgi:hypothetical protein
MQKVSLYIRNHSTRRYEKVKPKTTYPMGTIYVLRYAGKWETLKDCPGTTEARVAAKRKEIELFTVGIEQPRLKHKAQNARAIDVLIDKYLSERAVQRNWRKHTQQAYALGLKLFLQSLKPSGKTMLDEIEGDDLRNYAAYLRKYRTSSHRLRRACASTLDSTCNFRSRSRRSSTYRRTDPSFNDLAAISASRASLASSESLSLSRATRNKSSSLIA